jgi:hypothetical protein
MRDCIFWEPFRKGLAIPNATRGPCLSHGSYAARLQTIKIFIAPCILHPPQHLTSSDSVSYQFFTLATGFAAFMFADNASAPYGRFSPAACSGYCHAGKRLFPASMRLSCLILLPYTDTIYTTGWPFHTIGQSSLVAAVVDGTTNRIAKIRDGDL